jgi:transposase InsO family protein
MWKRLNCYRFTEEFVKEGVTYLRNGDIPQRYAYPSMRDDFRKKYEGMQEKDEALWYGELRIVAAAEVDKVLGALYKEAPAGRDRFYDLVKRKYVGISRPRVQEFLNNQEVHQLTLPVRKEHVSKAIVMSKPMQRWQADLVDVSKYASPQNKNAHYLLTVIDCFSKFAWVEPLGNKQADTVAIALEQIFEQGGTPIALQTDNGGEFELEFDELLELKGVKHIRSRSYNPQANGQIERFNGTIKRMIRAHMLLGDTKVYVPRLPQTVETYNDMLHTSIGQAPVNAHSKEDLWPDIAKKLRSKALKSKKRGRKVKRVPLAVGDSVRVARIHKPMEKKETYWSRELYTVMGAIPAEKEWSAATYQLHDGRKFTRDRLQKVNEAALVRLPGKKKAARAQGKKTVAQPEPAEERVQPRRERAPSSRLKGHFVDY